MTPPPDVASSRVAVFGLGEAGSAIAADLVSSGASVSAYDPAPVEGVAGVRRVDDPVAAVYGADVVLAVTAAADARIALTQALDSISTGALYADLATASPARKQELAEVAATGGLVFVDVALMSTVPGKGIRTPALAAGPGAEAYQAWLAPIGASIETVGDEPGAAATRKLLRSIVMKGLAGLVIEAMRAANAAESGAELWAELVREFTAMDEAFLHRLVTGTGPHALRRLHEMEAATELIAELGVVPHLTEGTVANLRAVPVEGLPPIPVRKAPRSTGTVPR